MISLMNNSNITKDVNISIIMIMEKKIQKSYKQSEMFTRKALSMFIYFKPPQSTLVA